MKKLLLLLLISLSTFSQTISIVGTGVNGWPDNQTGPEITLSTTDNIVYSISNLQINTGEVKFRQDLSWATNWGGNSFPTGTGVLNGVNIQTIAGTYTVTFNRITGAYNFAGVSAFPTIDIWGTAVDSQNGFGGNGVVMQTSNGINYSLSGFFFSSGSAYFRQDTNSNLVWGAVAFPTGIAVQQGPTIPVTGGDWSVLFNRNSGEFSFNLPSIGILGTALNGFGAEDTDLSTTDGFTYTINNLVLSNGAVKFRRDNSWSINWGGNDFPSGTASLNGNDIPVSAGTYNITFERTSGSYNFQNILSILDIDTSSIVLYPNPSENEWNISLKDDNSFSATVFDNNGRTIATTKSTNNMLSIDNSDLSKGVYFISITTDKGSITLKAIKN